MTLLSDEVQSLTRHPGVLWTDEEPLAATARKKLKKKHMHLFQDQEDSASTELGTLFNQFGTAICRSGCVARKEVFETWAAALQIYQHHFLRSDHNHQCAMRRRVVDVAGGHGLLAWALLILDDFYNHNPPLTALCVDSTMPKAVDAIATELLQDWPQLEGRLDFVEAWLQQVKPHPSCLMVSVHACAGLSDLLIHEAATHQTPIALVPCCHSRKKKHIGSLAETSTFAAKDYQALLDLPEDDKVRNLADHLDDIRINVLKRANFDVSTVYLPELFSAKTRVIFGTPPTSTPEGETENCTTIEDKIQQPTAAALPGRMPPLVSAKDKFLAKFDVPCQDSKEAREAVKALAGRKAAIQRRQALQRKNHTQAPTFHLSLHMPSDAPRDLVGFDRELAAFLATLDSRHLACDVEQMGATYVQNATGRKSQVFRIAYYEQGEDRETRKAMLNKDAKGIQQKLRDAIPTQFPGWSCR